ncbi:hypothetical protein Tco_1061869 [Tanacetum coccineum]
MGVLQAATTASSLKAKKDSGGAEAQTRFEAASKQSNDPPLSRVNTLGSGEDSMKLNRIDGTLYKIVKFGEQKEKRDVCELKTIREMM